MITLKSVYEKLNQISTISSRNDKEVLVKQFCDTDLLFAKVVEYAYDINKKFNITKLDYVENYMSHFKNGTVPNLWDVLDYLNNKSGATLQDKLLLSLTSSIDKETFDVVTRIVNKDLRCGVKETFKKYNTNITDYGVMLCQDDISRFFKHIQNDHKKAVWSLKLDGVRCTSYLNNNQFVHKSRNGLIYPNFSLFDSELMILYNRLNIINLGFDGECIAVSKSKTERKTFQKLMTQLSRLKDVDNSILRFKIFDIKVPNMTFQERQQKLWDVFNSLIKENVIFKYIEILDHYPLITAKLSESQLTEVHTHPKCEIPKNYTISSENIITPEDVTSFTEYLCLMLDHEGIVLKTTDSLYQDKRSVDWCKIKKFDTEEFSVIGWVYGKGKYTNVVGKLICLTTENKQFEVGSGLTDSERELFMNTTPQVIEVKFQGYTDSGKPRFPTFVRVREDK